MTVYIEQIADVSFEVEDLEGVTNKVVRAACNFVACPYEIAVNVFLTDNANIKELNHKFRQIDRSTDVLSFPLIEYDSVASFQDFDQKLELFDPDTKELMLGDIVISKEKAKEQSNAYGHSILREYAFLLAHSMLHLFGYDHMVDDERKTMEQAQNTILDSLAIHR